MDYSKLLKDLRRKSGLTQTEFGNKLGLSLTTIQKYEAGDRNPTETLKKLISYVFAEYIEPEKDGIESFPGRSVLTGNNGEQIFATEAKADYNYTKGKLLDTQKEKNFLQEKVNLLQEKISWQEQTLKDKMSIIEGKDLIIENKDRLIERLEQELNEIKGNGRKTAS